MKKVLVIILAYLVQSTLTFCQTEKNDFPVLKGPYLGQNPPGKKAELFAPQIINFETHDSPIITQDESEIFIPTFEGVKYYKMVDGVWSSPAYLPFNVPANFNGMHLSPTGNKLYFLLYEDGDENFYVSEKNRNKWSSLRSMGDAVNEFNTHWQFSTALNENFYYSSEATIMVSVFDGEKHLKAVPVKFENGENMQGGTPFIAPDESYLIYSTGDSERHKMADLHISYKFKNKKWSMPINLGSSINDKESVDLCPVITPGGKYLFFVSRREKGAFKLYWVSADIIEELRPKE